MPETVRMALARCCQRQTNVTVQEKKVSWSLPLDKGHFLTGVKEAHKNEFSADCGARGADQSF